MGIAIPVLDGADDADTNDDDDMNIAITLTFVIDFVIPCILLLLLSPSL